MKILNILEGISPVVYHTTSIENAHKILKSNTFRLSSDMASRESDFSNGSSKYWMSTSRSFRNSFSDNMPTSITFEMNGTTLSHNHSGKPVNYFAGNPDNNEMEDRVFSNKRHISNASRFMSKLFLRSNDGIITKKEYSYLQEIFKMAENMGINIDVRINNNPAALSQFKVVDDYDINAGASDSRADPTEIVTAIISVLKGEIKSFSTLKKQYPSSVKYLIGQTPKEFEENIRQLLSSYSDDERVDPLISIIRKKFGSISKFADNLYRVMSQI